MKKVFLFGPATRGATASCRSIFVMQAQLRPSNSMGSAAIMMSLPELSV